MPSAVKKKAKMPNPSSNTKEKTKKVPKSKRRQPKEIVLSKAVKNEVKKTVDEEVKRIEAMPIMKQGEELIKLINENFDFKANSGQSVDFPLNTDAFSIFVQCWVDRVCMLTQICVGPNAIAPVDLAMFCWMALILHIRRTGQLTGNTISQIPSFAEDIQIPVPLASFLSYFGKYIHADQNFVTSYELPSGFMNANLNVSQLDPNLIYPFPVYNGGLVYDKMYPGGISELVADRQWTPITVAQWCSTRLYTVANALKALNIPTVPSQSVGKYAPGIEAYCCRGIDQYSLTLIPNRVYSLVTPVDFELATVLSINRNRIIQQTWRSAPITSPTFNPAFGYGTMTVEHYLAAGLVFLLIQQPEYRFGRVKQVYRLGKSKISTFAWNVKYISGTQFKQLLAANYLQLQEQLPNFKDDIDGSSGFRQCFVIHVLSALHLHHRCEQNSPATQQALRLTGSSAQAAMAFYNEGIVDAVSLPAALVEFIESLGVVITDGGMVFPWLRNKPNSPSNTWGDPSFAGNMIEMSWKGLNYAGGDLEFYPFPWQGATVLKPNVSTGFYKWDVAFQTNYDAVNTPTFPYPIQHPAMSVNDFVEIWKTITGTQIYNNFALTLVHAERMKVIRFGEAYQMLSVASSGGIRRINIYPVNQELSASVPSDEKVGSPVVNPPLYVDAPIVTYVGSSVVLNRAEALQATILPSFIDQINISGATSTFLCKMTATNSYMMLEEAINRVTQSGLDNTSFTLNQQKSAPTLKALPGGELMPVKPKDNATPSAWDQTVHEVGARLIPPAVGTAASVACDFIPIIGPFISGLCGAGASALASALTSRSTVTSQHNTEASSPNPLKSQLSSINTGMAKFGHALRASGDAINGARDIVSKFAVAQVKGINYRMPRGQ